MTSSIQTEVTYTLDSKEAVNLIKVAPKGSKFQVMVRCALPVQGEDGQTFPGLSCLFVSRADFVKTVTDQLQYLEARGARIAITVSTSVYGGTYYSI
jgi:hypothetical protein